MKLSIIIPAYNEERVLPATLARINEALSQITTPAEVIVVDNASTDKTSEVAQLGGAVVVLETEHNISQVRNMGAHHATGDVLIFIDADTSVPPSLFEKISEAMNDSNCFGGAVAVNYDNLERPLMKLYLGGWKIWVSLFEMAQGATQFCRRSVFEEVGGYDRTIFVGEDIEFYWRLARFTRRNKGHLHFIKHPQVVTSARRFNKMSLWKVLLLTHPLFVLLAWRKRGFWNDWYLKSVR